MNVSVRSYLTSGLAVITAGAIMAAPTEPQHATAATEGLPVALAAQTRPLPLPAPPTLALPSQLPGLLGQQVSFNAGVAVDFIVTGAQLTGRLLQIPGTLVADIENGTPVPVAVGRAVVSFANVELDAGRELVGFARELADFQIHFAAGLVSGTPAIIAVPVGNVLALGSAAVDTVSDLATGLLDDMASVPAPGANAQVQSASVAPVTESARQSVQTGARHRLDDALTGRLHELKSSAMERDTADVGGSVSAPRSERHVTHKLHDGVSGNAATAVSASADKPNVRSEHPQRHRRDGEQNNNGGIGQADHRSAND